jgi:RimJ/RimL family protein N-acetyltransferase
VYAFRVDGVLRTVLEGYRVTLRPFTLDDVQLVYDACQDEEIHRWTVTLPWPYTEQDAHNWIESHPSRRRSGSSYDFAVVEAGTRSFCGSITLARHANEPRSAGVGYWIAPWARNRGYASEALRLLVQHAFDDTGINRIILITMVGNVASERVAAKAGFEVTGTDDAHRFGVGPGASYAVRVWERRRV